MSIGKQRERQRQREEQWRYLMNREAERHLGDLLAQIPPDRERILEVQSTGEAVPSGARLWARPSENGALVEFLRGESLCGRAQAEVIAHLGTSPEATLFVAISDQDNVLALRALPLDRRALRPPTGDDDVH